MRRHYYLAKLKGWMLGREADPGEFRTRGNSSSGISESDPLDQSSALPVNDATPGDTTP
jgi:hypothetical protein